MFAKSIIDSDAFLDMPLSSQALYFHLSMRADDEGFVNNPKKIQRMIGASDDDLKVLLAKNFIIAFESGVIVIKHWKIHNYIRGDRINATNYQEEKALLELKENGSYTLCLPNVSQMSDSCPSNDRIGKVRLGKDRLGKDNLNSIRDTVRPTGTVERIVEKWNALSDLGIKPILKLGEGTQRREWLLARLKTYTEEDFCTAIENIRHSLFLQGHGKKGWVITFDWFVRPNNFPKVLEGNYNDIPFQTDNGKNNQPEEKEREWTPEEWAQIQREHPDLFDGDGNLIDLDDEDGEDV